MYGMDSIEIGGPAKKNLEQSKNFTSIIISRVMGTLASQNSF